MTGISLNPSFVAAHGNPLLRLDDRLREVRSRGVRVVDLGVGDPREETPAAVRAALVRALQPRSGYPRAAGVPALREAIARWIDRRFGVSIDADSEVIPTWGSKEAIFTLAEVLVDPRGERNLVVATEPGYPVPLRAARVHGAATLALPLLEAGGFLPDLDSVEDATWRRVALLWVNYPNNPTTAVAAPAFLERAARLARRHGFVLASDEAYSEIYFDTPPRSALEVGDRANVVVFNTLSKRSAMTGYRSGFVAGPREIIEAVRTYRSLAGLAPQSFVQEAAIVAWDDDEHVVAMREAYARKRALLLSALAGAGIATAGDAATIYLWLRVPGPTSAESFADRLLDHGIVVTPGTYFGAAGEGYCRMALVASLEDCEHAAAMLGQAVERIA